MRDNYILELSREMLQLHLDGLKALQIELMKDTNADYFKRVVLEHEIERLTVLLNG